MVYFSGGVENSVTVDCRILSLMYCTGFASILINSFQTSSEFLLASRFQLRRPQENFTKYQVTSTVVEHSE
jgi:hypothetical protein